ncbi:MAG: glucuronate isomerase [Ferruginibacter sp.]|nr:glucuronate isomerase [Cytophagales bacterium]
MKPFLDDNFLLQTPTAERLYHGHAERMPILDYHCHLSPRDIAEDRHFDNLTEIWLAGDHYKWRAMRTRGINERYITGDAPAREKFAKWAETVPHTMRNPLYHWTHLELRRYFDIPYLLNPASAEAVYESATAQLRRPDSGVRNLIRRMRVAVICTTDDPADSLEYHRRIAEDGFQTRVFPTFRPDKAMDVENAAAFNAYLDKLGEAADVDIADFRSFLDALQRRHDAFHALGGRLSDHGLETMYAEATTESEIKTLFSKLRSKPAVNPSGLEVRKFKSAMLQCFGEMDHAKGWTQQFHLGALRNNSARMARQLGPDTGFDSIGDFEQARPLSRFLNQLDTNNRLAKTILYNLNPGDNELFASMIGNFNDGSTPGKMQFGSAWWFLDQKDGMEKQLNALSNLGLLGCFVGMITDSRSFLSYPRHEYFRRVLCNLLGNDVENGELPADLDWLGQMVENICYHNAKNYFGFNDR